MSNIKRIILDMDDVLNKFYHAFWAHYELDLQTQPYLPEFGWDMLGMVNHYRRLDGEREFTLVELWDTIPPEFWSSVPKADHCDDLIQLAVDHVGEDEVYLATSPTKCSGSMGAKHQWIVDNLPSFLHRKFFITPRKWLLGKPGVVLIDDCQANIDKIQDEDGDGITFPALWNPQHRHYDDPMRYVDMQLRIIEKVGNAVH